MFLSIEEIGVHITTDHLWIQHTCQRAIGTSRFDLILPQELQSTATFDKLDSLASNMQRHVFPPHMPYRLLQRIELIRPEVSSLLSTAQRCCKRSLNKSAGQGSPSRIGHYVFCISSTTRRCCIRCYENMVRHRYNKILEQTSAAYGLLTVQLHSKTVAGDRTSKPVSINRIKLSPSRAQLINKPHESMQCSATLTQKPTGTKWSLGGGKATKNGSTVQKMYLVGCNASCTHSTKKRYVVRLNSTDKAQMMKPLKQHSTY